MERPGRGLFDRVDGPYQAAVILTRLYYVGLLLIAFWHLSLWHSYARLREIRPLWPVFWAPAGSDGAAMATLALFVGGALVAALFPDRRLARAAAFAGCLEFFAFVWSFGTIRHVDHLLVLTTFLFVLLPRVPEARGGEDRDKRAYLRAFWGVQCGALLTYSMSGFVKIVTGLWHLATGQGGVLTPSAFALHVANSGIRFGVDPPLAAPVLRMAWLGLPLYLAVIYLELGALPVAFRPRLHRAWGVTLIVLHIAIGLTLNLFFTSSILVLGVLLLASPFAPESTEWRAAARDLPLIGRLLGRPTPTS